MPKSAKIAALTLVGALLLWWFLRGGGGAALNSAPYTEEQVKVANSFLLFCLTPAPETEAYTCVLEQESPPQPSLYEPSVYQGLDKAHLSKTEQALVAERQKSMAFLKTGRRRRVIREYTSGSVYLVAERDVDASTPLESLGRYSAAWDTNFAVASLFDAKARLGYKTAFATPPSSSVFTAAEGKPQLAHRFWLLQHGLELDVSAQIISTLQAAQTVTDGAIAGQDVDELPKVPGAIDGATVRKAFAGRYLTVTPAGGTNLFEVSFDLGESAIHALYSTDTNSPIRLPQVAVSGPGGRRTIRREMVAGKPWVAQVIDASTNSAGAFRTAVYYYHADATTELGELTRFSRDYVEGAASRTQQDAAGRFSDLPGAARPRGR